MSKRTKTIVIIGLLIAAAAATIFVIRGWDADPRAIEAEAESSFLAENYDDARIQYLNLLRIEPENALAHQRVGQVYLRQGLPWQAAPWLARSLAFSPERTEAREDFVQILISLGDAASARREALKILDTNPTHTAAILAAASGCRTAEEIYQVEQRLAQLDPSKHAAFHLVQALFKSKKGAGIASISESLDRALELEPELPAVHRSWANIFAAKKDKEKLKDSLALAARYSSPRSKDRISYAKFLTRNGETDAAREFLTKLTSEAPDYLPAWLSMAELSAAEKDNEKALSILKKNVFARDATNYDGQVFKAQILLSQKKVDEAIKLYEELDTAYSNGQPANRIRIKLALARMYFSQGELEKCANVLELTLQIAPKLPAANLLRAEVYLRMQEPAAAAKILEPLLTDNPRLVQAQLLLAQAYRGQERFDDAAAIYLAQIKQNSEQATPHLLLGNTYYSQGKYAEAMASLEKAQQLAPDDLALTLRLIELDFRNKDSESAHRRALAHVTRNKDAWGGYYLQGRVFFTEKKWKEAEAALSKALELKPDSSEVYRYLIDSYLASEQQEKAIERLRELLEREPKSERERMVLALLLEAEQREEEAAQEFATLITHHPDHVPALNNLAYLTSKLFGDHDKALELARRAQELEPDNVGVADTLGWIHYNRKEYSEALPLLERAVAKDSENSEILYHLGMTRLMMGQEDAGKKALEAAVASEEDFSGKELAQKRLAQMGTGTALESIDEIVTRLKATPGNLPLRLKLADMYAKKGEFEKAAASFNAALKLNSDLLGALVGLARLHADPLDDLKKAKKFADRARALAPQDPGPAAARGIVALREGDYSYAYSLLQTARRGGSAGDDPQAEYAWAQAAYGLGKLNEAREAMAKLLASGSEALEKIKKSAQSFLTLTDDATANPEQMLSAAKVRLQQDPQDLPALMVQAFIQEQSGQTDQARATYEATSKRLPSFIPSKIRLAALYARDSDRRGEAQTLALKVQSVLPSDPVNTSTLGILAYHKGDWKYAVQLLKPLNDKKAFTAEGFFYLGMAHAKQEEKPEATSALEEALTAGLPDDLTELAKEALASLQESASDEPGC